MCLVGYFLFKDNSKNFYQKYKADLQSDNPEDPEMKESAESFKARKPSSEQKESEQKETEDKENINQKELKNDSDQYDYKPLRKKIYPRPAAKMTKKNALTFIPKNISIASVEESSFNEFEFKDVTYQKIGNFIALDKRDFSPMQYPIYEVFNTYYIVELGEGETLPDGALTMLKTKDSPHGAVFTGILKVKLFHFSDAGSLIQDLNSKYNLNINSEIKEEHENINVVFYQFDSFEDTMKVYELITTPDFSEQVQRVNIDLNQWYRGNN